MDYGEPLQVNAGDTLTVTGDATFSSASLTLDGTLTVGGSLSTGGGAFTIDGGTLDVTGPVSGSSDVVITGGGFADFAGAFDQNVALAGFAILELGQSQGYTTGIISGYSDAAVLDLTDIQFDL